MQPVLTPTSSELATSARDSAEQDDHSEWLITGDKQVEEQEEQVEQKTQAEQEKQVKQEKELEEKKSEADDDDDCDEKDSEQLTAAKVVDDGTEIEQTEAERSVDEEEDDQGI